MVPGDARSTGNERRGPLRRSIEVGLMSILYMVVLSLVLTVARIANKRLIGKFGFSSATISTQVLVDSISKLLPEGECWVCSVGSS